MQLIYVKPSYLPSTKMKKCLDTGTDTQVRVTRSVLLQQKFLITLHL